MRRDAILAVERGTSSWFAADPEPVYVLTSDAARTLRVSPEMVREFVRQRRLPCTWTGGRRPQRLFHAEDIDRLATERQYLALAPPPPRSRRRAPAGQLRLRLFRTAQEAKGRLRILK
jgi:hypothetical protein